MSQAAAELFREEAPDVEVAVGRVRHRWRLRALLRRRDRHLRRLAPDRRGREVAALRGGRHRVHRAPGRHRRADGRRAPRPRVDCLTVDQLIELWAPGLDDHQLERARPELPRPGDRALRSRHRLRHLRLHGRRGRRPRRRAETTRDDYEASEDDNVLVQGVAGTEGATGYFGYTYYEENADILKALAIDDGNGCVEPSAETAQAGEYTPLARPLFIYVANANYADNEAVEGVHRLLHREPRDDRGGRAVHPAERRRSTPRRRTPSRASAADRRRSDRGPA